MKIRHIAIALAGTIIGIGASASAWAQQTTCTVPNSSCSLASNVTTSQVQIGGPGSISSNNNTPAQCDDSTPVSARFDLSFDRAAAKLTIVVTNTTQAPFASKLTGFGFNVGSGVTGLSLSSVTGSSLTWSAGFDANRAGDGIDIPSLNPPKELKCDGFGRFNVFSGNNGIDTGFGGGNPTEIAPGAANAVTFVFDVTGNLANVTACSFTSVASLIPPGDKTVIAVARFQSCSNAGGSTWAGPCSPQDLLVSLLKDLEVTDVDDGIVRLRWETASEIDNAGFAILEQGARSGQYARLNSSLIPAQGSPTSGAVYTYDHISAVNGRKIRLRLEDFDLNGWNTIHKPVDVVPNPKNPPIRTAEPAYEASLNRRGAMRLEWTPVAASSRRVLQISSDPTFPENGTLEINVGSTTSRTLSKKERDLVADMAALGDGGVYWRVKGRNAGGGDVVSDVSLFNVTE